MKDFYLFDFNNFDEFEKVFISNNRNKNLVFMCIGTNNYLFDSFGVKAGNEFKKLKIFVYGSSKREINGLNFINVYNFIKKKHKSSKIIIVDSVYSDRVKKPILIYKNSPINVSFLNNKQKIGNEGILFNSFNFYNFLEFIIIKLKNMIKKCINY